MHRTRNSLLLCYVAHHDGAYQWAERRKLETHPRTGAAQLVEVREIVQEIAVPQYVVAEQEVQYKLPLLTDVPESDLLSYGVPPEWLNDVRNADEDGLLELAEHLPDEAGEALLELAVGGTPQIAQPVTVADPFDHPDAQRPLPVDDKCGRTEACARLSLGEVGDLPTSGATGSCRERLQWSVSRVRYGGYGKNRCGYSSRRVSGA